MDYHTKDRNMLTIATASDIVTTFSVTEICLFFFTVGLTDTKKQ